MVGPWTAYLLVQSPVAVHLAVLMNPQVLMKALALTLEPLAVVEVVRGPLAAVEVVRGPLAAIEVVRGPWLP